MKRRDLKEIIRKNKDDIMDCLTFRKANTTQIIISGFLIIILLGLILLSLPFSQNKGIEVSMIDNIFTAVTSVCVTGLTTVNIAKTYSVFGKCVILLLIQIGGLGVVTVTMIMFNLLKRKRLLPFTN